MRARTVSVPRIAGRWTSRLMCVMAIGARASGVHSTHVCSSSCVCKAFTRARRHHFAQPRQRRPPRIDGISTVGVYRRIGFKCGAWHDVAWYQLPLREFTGEPAEPITYDGFTEEAIHLPPSA